MSTNKTKILRVQRWLQEDQNFRTAIENAKSSACQGSKSWLASTSKIVFFIKEKYKVLHKKFQCQISSYVTMKQTKVTILQIFTINNHTNFRVIVMMNNITSLYDKGY